MIDLDAMPVAPGGEGWLGHNRELRDDRMGAMARLLTSPEPILRLRLPFPGVNAVAVVEPDLIQEMLVEKGRSFAKSDMLRFTLFPLAGEGLFTSNGELWRRQRKLMAPLFQPRALEAYADDMVASAERTVARFVDGDSFALLPETTRLTMSVAGKTLFDVDTFSEADAIGHALTVALEWTGFIMARPFAVGHVLLRRALEDLAPIAPGWAKPSLEASIARLRGPVALVGTRGRELAEAIALLDDRVARMIAERRADSSPRSDLLSRLLAARDERGMPMSDRQVRDEVLTLFVAGHETTATGLAWTIYLLARHPEVYAAVEREVDALAGPPTVADLPRLGMTLGAFKEALRLYPPVYLFGRDAMGEVSLGGYRLPARTNAIVSPWVLHRLPRLWPDPERFDPERFAPEAETSRHRFAYLPFGAGPRVCMGNHFAFMEAQLALAVMLRAFHFESLGEDHPVAGATLRPRDGIRVRITRRSFARRGSGETHAVANAR